MSVTLTDIRVPASFRGAKRPLLNRVSMEIPDGARIGVLGVAKSGKTTLLRVLCGTQKVDDGFVARTSRTSWPIPLPVLLNANWSVALNIRFFARLYGVADDGFPRRIAEMVGIAEFLEKPLGKCPRLVKPRLAFALGIGIDFDIYLFDGSLTPVDKEFKEQASGIAAGRLQGRGYVLATANPTEVEPNCDYVYVLEAGRLRYFDDTKEGVEYFKQLVAAEKQKKAAEKEAKGPGEDDEEAEGLGDIDVITAAIADEVE
jgi:capsular polysaccharide transport system ATP-binding protein